MTGGVEPGVEAPLGHQRVVRPLLDDAAGLQHDDLVSVAHGGEAMGDDQARAAGEERLQRPLDLQLGERVDVGGGLVEDIIAMVTVGQLSGLKP